MEKKLRRKQFEEFGGIQGWLAVYRMDVVN